MKNLLIALFVCSLVSVSYAADFSVTSNPFGQSLLATKFSNGASMGFLNTGGVGAGVFSWNPDFNNFGIGLGLSINVPLSAQGQPTGVDTVVLRYLEYANSTWGVKYGILSNVTLANGLLVSNYTTATKGGIIQSSGQSGLRVYYNWDYAGLECFGTWTGVYGARLTEKVLPFLTLGQYVAGDTDGVKQVRPDGTTKQFPPQSGWGVDANIPLTSWANLFAEYAKLNNYGGGFSAGLNAGWNFLLGQVNLKAERRIISKNFIPGYYNEAYEVNPVDIVSYEATATDKDGYSISLYGDVLSKAKFLAIMEAYNNSNTSLRAEALADLTEAYFAGVSYVQPDFRDFRSLDVSQGAIITGKLGYKINPFTRVIANYKQAWDPSTGRVLETQWYEVSLAF